MAPYARSCLLIPLGISNAPFSTRPNGERGRLAPSMSVTRRRGSESLVTGLAAVLHRDCQETDDNDEQDCHIEQEASDGADHATQSAGGVGAVVGQRAAVRREQ